MYAQGSGQIPNQEWGQYPANAYNTPRKLLYIPYAHKNKIDRV